MLGATCSTAAEFSALLRASATLRVLAKDLQIGDIILSGVKPFVVARVELVMEDGPDSDLGLLRLTGPDGVAVIYRRTFTPSILRRDLVRAGVAEEAAAELGRSLDALKDDLARLEGDP